MRTASLQQLNSDGLTRASSEHAGKTGVAHEAPIQGYFLLDNYSPEFRMANDRSIAVKQESNLGGKELYASKAVVNNANQKLKQGKSPISFTISGSADFDIPKKTIPVNKKDEEVEPSNENISEPQNKKQAHSQIVETETVSLPIVEQKNTKSKTMTGEKMKLPQDCGNACSEVTGVDEQHILNSGKPVSLKNSSPILARTDMFISLFEKQLNLEKVKIARKEYIKQSDLFREYYINVFMKMSEEEREKNYGEKTKKDKPRLQAENDLSKLFKIEFEKLGNEDKENFMKQNRLNEFANPDIGEGYLITRGGKAQPDSEEKIIPFHWAGVVMKSEDGTDTLSMENMAQGFKGDKNTKWWHQLYGQQYQSFHSEVGLALNSTFGTEPVTLTVGRKN